MNHARSIRFLSLAILTLAWRLISVRAVRPCKRQSIGPSQRPRVKVTDPAFAATLRRTGNVRVCVFCPEQEQVASESTGVRREVAQGISPVMLVLKNLSRLV